MGKVFALQTRGPEFEPKNIHKMGQVWRGTLVFPALRFVFPGRVV